MFLFYLALNLLRLNVISLSVEVFNFKTSKKEAISSFNFVRFFLRIAVFAKFILINFLRVEDVKLAVKNLANNKNWQQNNPNDDGWHEHKTLVPFIVLAVTQNFRMSS